MAGRIGVLEAGQSQTAAPRNFVRKAVANHLVKKMLAVWVAGRAVIHKLLSSERVYQEIYREAKGYSDGELGVGNALPFSPPTDAGKHYHYEVPHAGDVGLWRHFRKKIQVSARPQSHLAAPLLRRTQLKAPVVSLADAFPA